MHRLPTYGLDDDLARGEPVLVVAAVQHHLQCTDPGAEYDEAEPIEAQMALVVGVVHEQQQAECGEQAERQVDIEHVAPVVHLGEIAAESRAEDRAYHHAHAPDRHGEAAPLHRIDVEQDRLRQRHQGGAANALQQAEHDDLFQRLRRTAHHGGDGETDDADDEQPLATEACGEPAHRRGHDRRGGDVGGEHPGDLVVARREAALHVGKCDVGDGLVERLQQGGADDARGDHAAMRRALQQRDGAGGGGHVSVARQGRHVLPPAPPIIAVAA